VNEGGADQKVVGSTQLPIAIGLKTLLERSFMPRGLLFTERGPGGTAL
jgi:hypothetical protein